jgi:WD40 repeat protein
MISVSSDQKINIIAYPDKEIGSINVLNTDTNISTTIKAHDSNIAFISLNSEGTLVATASEKGTLIRIYRVDNGELLQELRRGKEKAEIYSISFDHNNLFLACSSDRGTIHIFSLYKVNEKIKDLKKKEEYDIN